MGRTAVGHVRTRVQSLSSVHSTARPAASVTTSLLSSLIDIHKPMCHEVTPEPANKRCPRRGSDTHSVSDLQLGFTAFVRPPTGAGRVLGTVVLLSPPHPARQGAAMNSRFVEQTVVRLRGFERPMSQCPDTSCPISAVGVTSRRGCRFRARRCGGRCRLCLLRTNCPGPGRGRGCGRRW